VAAAGTGFVGLTAASHRSFPETNGKHMLDYRKTRDWHSGDVRHVYTAKDTILYALGLGFGADPLDAQQLRFVYEKDLLALPSMAAVLASPGFWMRDRKELGIDATKLVHGEQSVRMHATLRPAGTVIGRTRVARIVDKGVGKGAVLHVEKTLFDEASSELIATVESVYFCRGDGGFSAVARDIDPTEPQLRSDEAAPASAALPDGTPDLVLDLNTRADQALLYRLSGDLNPLHADPAMAAKAGFEKPILHGLATWGIVCRGLVGAYAGFEPGRLAAMSARLSAPVYPGEAIRLECWNTDGVVRFRARAVHRDVAVLTLGLAQILGT
jgi:acyl dehydratase